MNKSHLEYLASPAWADRLATELLPWIERVADLGDDVLEIGPGPGLTTDILRQRAARVTAVEIDDALAGALAERLRGTNVEVIRGTAADTGLAAGRFSAATSFSMLHHVPSAREQDRILAEVYRVLRPGAALLVTDARDLDALRERHADDVFVPLSEDTLVSRLHTAGFTDVEVEIRDTEIRFTARKA
jgi:SAM-dependent methyltransferase